MKKVFKKLSKNKELVKFIVFSALIFIGFLLGTNFTKIQSLTASLPQKTLPSEKISAVQLQDALANKSFTLINVHVSYEGEIKKTDAFIEYDSLMANKEKLPQDKNAVIVLYCKSGRMSAEALSTLKGMGYTNVSHLSGGMRAWEEEGFNILDLSKLPKDVLPEEGFELPVSWGDIGPILLDIGVIDLPKFEKAMDLTDEQKRILTKGSDGVIKINQENSHFVVNILWAAGLAQKSRVYEEGPMGKEYADRAGNFASTGGWTLARTDAIDYLNRYELIPLSSEQQGRVSEIAKNVYRPCCGNNTAFPDCNHGMAALGAIELMVYEGLSDEEIYRNVLKLNSFWFPQNYLTAATYFARQGENWSEVDAKLVLGQEFSSAQGARSLAEKVGPLPYEGKAGGSCGA